MSSSEIQDLEKACQLILELPEIRFVGVLDKMGKKIAGGFKKGVSSFLPEKENRMMYVQLTLEYLMRKDFDEGLGPIEYITSRRGKVTMISIPTKDFLVLISAHRDVNVEDVIIHVNSSFTTLPDIKP